MSGPEPTNNLSCRRVYPRPKLTDDLPLGSEDQAEGDEDLMEGDPWFPTVEDYLDCPPAGWEWVDVDEACPPPPDIHACDPQCKPPECPPWDASMKRYEEQLVADEKAGYIFDGIDMRTGQDVCRLGRCSNCGICGCTCLKTKGVCECDGSTPGTCGAQGVPNMKCMKEDPKMMRMMAGQDVSENSDACGSCDVVEDFPGR